jgi:CRP/FNR family transcriptional regulator, cyclic AMP receptor protein
VLFHRGDPGGALYVLRAGQVEMFVNNDAGERFLLETAGPGDFFGEISMLDGGSRTAGAVVTHDMEALVLDREHLDAFLRLRPAAAMDILAATGRRLRESANLLRASVSRNVNDEEEDARTMGMRIADWITAFSGSMSFLLLHCVLFAVWILLNSGPLARTAAGGWDPYPFGLLTMAVSLEAIVLSVFVLLSQNRQTSRDRVRNDIEYRVNLRAELEIAQLHKKVDLLHEYVARLAR